MLVATLYRAIVREIRKVREALSLSVAQSRELGGCEGAGTVVDFAGVEAHGFECMDEYWRWSLKDCKESGAWVWGVRFS